MKRITIIGGGASGTLLAINLLNYHGEERLEINLVEKRSAIGKGLAFGTEHDVHLLNVPAGKMGAFPNDVGHFHKWLLSKGHQYEENAFVPRKFFSEYLIATLDEVRSNAAANVVLNLFDTEAVAIDGGGVGAEVRLADGGSLYSESVVLAIGNFRPPHPTVSDLSFTNAPKYFHDPWSDGVEELIDHDDSILIVGTGLSMADAVMRLNQRGHRGKITAISTRGLLPAVHKLGFTYPSIAEELKGVREITKVLKIIRGHINAAQADSSDWRAVIDSLRPHTQQLWLDLPLAEKKYFMQHLSRYWNVARHRMPPETYAVIAKMQDAGRLEIIKGRLKSIKHDGVFNIDFTFYGKPHTIRTDAIVNCIASESNFKKLDSPLVRDLFAKGSIRNDALNFGLDAFPDGAIIDAEGKRSRFLFTLGTALKGILWESTAIPEIRMQARNLANKLLETAN